MSYMWHQVVIFITLYLIWNEVSAAGEIFQSNVTLTWNDARKYCEDSMKVLLNALTNESMASLRKLLNGTSQTWVSARMEFSHFVKVPVCMAISDNFGQKKSFDTDIIYNCLKFCSDHLYAGVKDRDCYCLNDSSKLSRSGSCYSTCNNDPSHQCGGNDSISLYEKVNKIITQKMVHGCKECVYARNTRGDVKIFTESCAGHLADGAMCEAVNDKACSENKWTILSNKLCRIDRANSLNWKQAKTYCSDIGGNLMSSTISGLNMIQNSTYWFGLHRIPIIHKVKALELDTNDMCCAVARKEEDIVLIEGDDCRSKHAFICQDESSQSIKKPIPGERSHSEPTDRNIIYGVVAVSAVLLVALVITVIVCICRRQQVSQERANRSATHSTIEEHALLEKQISSPPPKPSRKTHTKKENIDSSYENVIFVCGRQDVSIHQSDYSNNEYDKINLDRAHVQEDDNSDSERHVYDHGSLNKTEEQYDVMNMPGDIIPIMDETYDRTTF